MGFCLSCRACLLLVASVSAQMASNVACSHDTGNCFWLYSSSAGASPDTAHAKCAEVGLGLAMISTDHEWNVVRGLIDPIENGQCIRIGATKISHNNWQWRDGTTAFPSQQPGATITQYEDPDRCSCWWSDDNIMYDAHCGSFGYGTRFLWIL